MRKVGWRFPVLLAALAGLFGPGCGGGGSAPTAVPIASAGRGTVRLALRGVIVTPPRSVTRADSGAIPYGAKSVQVFLRDAEGNDLQPPRIIVKDFFSEAPPEHVEFSDVPAGRVHLEAMAYPDAEAQQEPLARGSAEGEVEAGRITNISVPVFLTASAIQAEPTSLTLVDRNSTGTLSAEVQNASGNAVGYELFWESSDPDIVEVNQFRGGSITVTARDFGTSIITVRELNSGLSARITVTVFGL